MLKKIAVGALLAGLVGVLIFGAVNRTNAVSGESAGETGRRGRTAEIVTADAGLQSYGKRSSVENETNSQGVGETGRWTQEGVTNKASEASGRGGRWGQSSAANQAQAGQGAGALSGLPQADVQVAGWVTIQGTVVSVADDLIEIETAAGEVIPFEGRPLSYALEQGFSLQLRDRVTLDGFDEDGEFKLGQVTNLGNETSVTLRDASGRPGWSGQGRQG